MNIVNDRNTKFFIRTGFFEIATIYVVICGETARGKNGAIHLTAWGKKQIRSSVKKNLRKILPHLRPEIFVRAPKLYAEETILEVAKLLTGELNRKSIIALDSLDPSNRPEEATTTKDLWRKARKLAELKWYESDKRIRHYHWREAGGKLARAFKRSVEETLFDLARAIATRPDKKTQPIGLVAGSSTFFNLVGFDQKVYQPCQLKEIIRVEIPPLKPGDIIQYKFFIEGQNAEQIEFVGYQYFPA
ncbi:MAG TPA: hypothetical protein VMC41_02195 [Candidatus Nanoarchaeia archaeon]|nr:hypothetical protein [Candidatus Nanoarchaeia archaeon]